MKHTQGEWKYLQNEFREGEYLILGIEHRLIARISDEEVEENEAEANARLIASAPSILKALQDVLSMCEYPYKEMATYKEAQEVINKALGK